MSTFISGCGMMILVNPYVLEVIMRLEMLAKDRDSIQGGSQAMYLDQGGWFTIQGLLVDADTLGNVENLVPGEGVVRIKPEIVIEAVRRYQAR